MKALLLVVALFGVAYCATLDDEWASWQVKYNKNYADEAEASVRRVVWEDNWQFVQQHSSEEHTYEVEMNEFGDLTIEEFAKLYLSKINMNNESLARGDAYKPSAVAVPDKVDWREQGAVTEVKNQGQCGSCWAFSTTGSLEGQHKLKTGKLVSLSEQQLMDCSTKEGNHGCKGGLMDNAFRYIKENGGLDTEECYSYRAHDERCAYKKSCEAASDTGYTNIPRGSEKDLMDAVAEVGPISVAIDASHRSFQLYKRGVYNERECSSTKLDHGVLAIGYGVEEMEDYWLVKNSWGTRWGMEGYVMMSRNKDNQCGIATQASYPTGVTSS